MLEIVQYNNRYCLFSIETIVKNLLLKKIVPQQLLVYRRTAKNK